MLLEKNQQFGRVLLLAEATVSILLG